MISYKKKQLIIKYLEKNYSVSRVKINQKFKRAIVLDNGYIYNLNQKEQYNVFKNLLLKSLIKIFSDEPNELILLIESVIPPS